MVYLETFTGSTCISCSSWLLFLKTRYKEAISNVNAIMASNKSIFFKLLFPTQLIPRVHFVKVSAKLPFVLYFTIVRRLDPATLHVLPIINLTNNKQSDAWIQPFAREQRRLHMEPPLSEEIYSLVRNSAGEKFRQISTSTASIPVFPRFCHTFGRASEDRRIEVFRKSPLQISESHHRNDEIL